MFIYSKNGTWNVLVTLDDLETAVILLSQPTAALDPAFHTRSAWAEAVASTMRTGGMIHLIVTADADDDSLPGYRGPLSGLAERYRTRAMRALTTIAAMYGQRLVPDKVDCLGERRATSTAGPPTNDPSSS